MTDMKSIMPAPGGAKPLTMSSLEIAVLTGKRHAHVVRDIRLMLIELYGCDHVEKVVPERYRNRSSEYIRENADAIFSAISGHEPNRVHPFRGYSWRRDKRGYIERFDLDRSHSITVVTGYNVKARKAIIDRWEELEKVVASPAALLSEALHDPEQARLLLLEQVERAIELQATVTAQREEIGEMAPQAKAYAHIAECEGSYTVRQAAKVLKVPERRFVAWLVENGWAFRNRSTGATGRLLGYASREAQGHVTHRHHTYINSHGEDAVAAQVVITPKGMQVLAKYFGGGEQEGLLLS
ncbi:MAG: phage antirepressor KilAC domain-containing protein [Devosia sp.]